MSTNLKGRLTENDIARVNRLKERLQAANHQEVIRRALIFSEVALKHQEDGGDIVLCRQGMADKAVWFV